MLKPIKQIYLRGDNRLAEGPVSISTDESESSIQPPSKAQISMIMAQLGRKGGKIGGKRRLETMTAKARRRIAQKAANARWRKER